MSFYTGTTDTNLLRDIMLQSGKLYVKKWEYDSKGTTGTVGATCAISLDSGAVTTDDEFNNMTLFIVDDNGVLCSVNIDDSTASGDTITVDTTSCNKVSDESTAGAFTNSTEYDMYILGTEEFVGYSDQQLDYEEERIDFMTGDIAHKRVRSDALGIVAGFSGNVRSFGAEILKEIYGMTTYGDQTNKIQVHGGNQPAVRSDYAVILKMDNVKGHNWEIEFFKGQFYANGAITTSADEYKMIPYKVDAFIDTLRDSDNVNMWRLTQNTA